jgi:hypothetical protein
MMQKANVSHGKTKMDKVERVTLICCIEGQRHDANVGGKEKSDEEVKEEAKKALTETVILCSLKRCVKSSGASNYPVRYASDSFWLYVLPCYGIIISSMSPSSYGCIQRHEHFLHTFSSFLLPLH